MFDGKVVAITGGASGIGFATAERIIAQGGSVALIDVNGASAQEAANRLGLQGENAIGLAADVTDPQQVAAALDATLKRFGQLDGLVTSAGIRQSSERIADLSRRHQMSAHTTRPVDSSHYVDQLTTNL